MNETLMNSTLIHSTHTNALSTTGRGVCASMHLRSANGGGVTQVLAREERALGAAQIAAARRGVARGR